MDAKLSFLSPPSSAPAGRADLKKQADRLVSQTFFGTMLRQMRNSPFKSELFSGGRGGDAFTPLLDQHLADRMASSAGRSLSASIVKHLERIRSGGAGTATIPLTPTLSPASISPAARMSVVPSLGAREKRQ